MQILNKFTHALWLEYKCYFCFKQYAGMDYRQISERYDLYNIKSRSLRHETWAVRRLTAQWIKVLNPACTSSYFWSWQILVWLNTCSLPRSMYCWYNRYMWKRLMSQKRHKVKINRWQCWNKVPYTWIDIRDGFNHFRSMRMLKDLDET